MVIALNPLRDFFAFGIRFDGLEPFSAEAWIAFHRNTHLTVHNRLNTVLFTIDAHDEHVFARFLSSRFKSCDRAEGHFIVVRVNGGSVRMRLEQGLSDLASFVARKVAGL